MSSDKAFWSWIEKRNMAREQLATNRRTLLKGAGAATVLALGGGRINVPGVVAQSEPTFDGVTLRVFTQTGPFISGPVKFHAPEFKEQFGADVQAVEAPNADLFARA